ncbi:MAG: DUF134 domain-containing protein [Candidatus Omnitrophica bacterium]|nr:DUF134 domain-containing protein [Candidatus Omnitrophota bacterium]
MRPKKLRWITSIPREKCYEPLCRRPGRTESVSLELDEFEVLRLSHLLNYDQEEAAKQMRIHQSTVSRILNSAHKKITDALVNIKELKIEGGHYQLIERIKK